MSIKVLIVDDHALFRHGLIALMGSWDEVTVIADVPTGSTAIEAADVHVPDVVLIGVNTPELSCIESTRRIIAKHPETKVIGLSTHALPEYVYGMLNAGASGYLVKDCAFNEVMIAIKAAMDGMTYLSPKIAHLIVHDFKEHYTLTQSASALSEREQEVLQHIALGKSSKEIADILNLSVRTVTSHRQNIMDKLNCHDAVSLTKYAIRKGIISLDSV